MISYLKVRNLAIVEEFAIEPGPGLNVLTGETGAGKSLLIDSLQFLRGERSSAEMIRTGAEKMTAEAVIELPANHAPALSAQGVDVEVDADRLELIVKREIGANGRGRVLVNGSPLAVRALGELMEDVLEIHGQNESHQRVAARTFREIVDQFGGHETLLEAVANAFEAWRSASAQLREHSGAEKDRSLRLDLLDYQIKEIAAASLSPQEEEELRQERGLLSNAQEMIAAASGAFQLIDEDEHSALTQLGRSIHLLQPLVREVSTVREINESLQELSYRLQDLSRALHHLSDSVRHDPARLEFVEERLATIERLARKYGGSVPAALEHLARSQTEYEALRDFEGNLAHLHKLEQQSFARYRTAADKLSLARRKAAGDLQSAIVAELRDLAMERTAVRVEIGVAVSNDSALVIDGTPVAFGATGYDRVDILIAPNQGEEPRPMAKIASGGELSRIQLAIAASLFKRSARGGAATLIFDEIDAGIGGRVAEVVGRKLQELAAENQVICVTHLPQIASFGTTHFQVWKEEYRGHTRARIRRLESEEERVSELARMLAGEKVPASAMLHARELLEQARGKRARARA